MKQACSKFSAFLFAIAFLAPVSLLAQKEEKDKGVKEKKEAEQIIITRKGDKNEKVVIEIVGDKVTVNGKPVEDLKDSDITVRRSKGLDTWGFADGLNMDQAFNMNQPFKAFSVDSNRAMLGVSTSKTENGVEIESVTKESAAAKAGLKEGDIITKIDDKKIDNPDELSATIKSHKPGDKVTVTYLRDKKESKATADLQRYKGSMTIFSTPGHGFDMNIGDLSLEHYLPRAQATPRVKSYQNQNWSWSGGSGPKLGLSVQDTDDGKGVKIIEVDDESNAAKAGLKEDDIITEIDGKAVKSADEVAKIIRESKEKISVMLKLTRGNKTQNIEVKMPRRLKVADL